MFSKSCFSVRWSDLSLIVVSDIRHVFFGHLSMKSFLFVREI